MAQGDQRRLKIMLGILGVVVVVFVGRLVLSGGGGGGDDGDGDASATTTTFVLPEPGADPGGGDPGGGDPGDGGTDVPSGDDVAPEPGDTFDVFGSRNPFEPPILGGGTAPPPPTFEPGDDPFDGDDADSVDGDDPSDGGAPDDGTTPPPTSAANGTFDPQRQVVTLVDVYDDAGTYRASVQVDTTVYDVGVGEEFAGRYRVVSLDATCGQFLFGDATFRLCEGEQLIK